MTADREYEAEGGDPVCWMHLLCPSCGAMPDPADGDGPASTTCPRCGEERDG
jgi:ribosomal protein S27AE